MRPALPIGSPGSCGTPSTGSRHSPSRPRERHSRLSLSRRAADPASSSLSSRSPRPTARPAPALRAAAWLLAAALVLPGALLLSAGAAQAQSSVKLVGNTGQASGVRTTLARDSAQAFTTGGDPVGYRLTGVDIRVRHTAGNIPPYTVSIRRDSSGSPGTILGTLTNPASLPSSFANVRYTAPAGGIDLDANTKYWLVIDVTVGWNPTQVSLTNSDAEDTGAAAGWSIANTFLDRLFSANTWSSPDPQSLQIAIHGFARNPAPPGPPAAPTVSKTDGTSLTVTWAAPPYDLAAQPVTDYDVRYRRKGDTAWTDHPHSGTALTTTITGLLQGASWEAQVAASNANGPGRWSATGSGHTGPARLVRAETNATGVGIFVTFTKSLSDAIPDHRNFSVTRKNPDNTQDSTTASFAFLWNERTQIGISVPGSATIQAGQTVTLTYTYSTGVRLIDADLLGIADFTNKPVTNLVPATPPSPPAAPAAPTVSAVTTNLDLEVSWTAPSDGGSAITGYELRYYLGSSDPDDEADWVEVYEATGIPDLSSNTATSATISGLLGSTTYRVQVRAANANGDGPWSPSGSAGTNSSTATNQAPTRMQLGTSNNCVAKTANTAFQTKANVASGTIVSAFPILGTANCSGTNREAPMFGDADGDTLAITARVRSLPDNVRLEGDGITAPRTNDSVFFQGYAAFRQTDMTVDVTATDPHGAAVSSFFVVQLNAILNSNGVPTLGANPGPQRFALNAAIQPLVLPAATGGDTGPFPYFYAVDGLPAGLTFDAATRTVSGTPTALGTYRITYTAEDADHTASADRSPDTVDSSDTAKLTFPIQIGNQPGIERVRIVSKPQLDSDGDGTDDTYIRGASIYIDVEFNEPVVLGGTGDVRLRLDLGNDDANLGNSRETMDLDSVRHNGQTLRFKFTVGRSNTCTATTQQGYCDRDGIWVQPRSATDDQVVFLASTRTLTHAVTGEAADLTYGHLPTPGANAGDPLHKVDGSKQLGDVGPVASSATVNGDTLAVTFVTGAGVTGHLAEPADLDALRYDFFVRGAGGIGADDRDVSQSPSAIVYRSVVNGDSFTGLELTLGTPARAGDTVTLTYLGTTLKSTIDKRAPMVRGLAVTNDTPGTAGPMPLHASVTGTKLKMVFGADLDTASLPSGSAFLVEADDLDGDTRDIAGTGTVSIADDRVVTVTLASGMRADEMGSVSYEKPDSAPLRGSASGNPEVQSFKRFRIASAEDGVAPTLRGGTVVQTGTSPAKSKMVLYFDEALSTFSVPATGDFAVSVSGAAVTVSAVSVEDRSVVLTLDRLAASGTLFQVTYTRGTNPIRDWAGNAAAGFRQTVSAAADGAPAIQSARVEGAKVLLTYDKPLDPADTPDASGFIFHSELLTTGGLNQQIHGTPDDPDDPNDMDTTADTLHHDIIGITVSGRTAVLHLRHPVLPCAQAFELTYSKSAGSTETPFQGLDGTDAAALTSQAVVNARAYRCNNSNWMHGARVGSVILTAERPFATDVEPQASWFTVTASGGPVTVTGAAYSEDDEHELKLSLSRDLVPGETVTVSYRRPAGALGLWDTDGNQLGDIEDQAVSNPAPGAPPAPDAPAVTMASGTSVSVRWTAPDTTGLEALTGYDVQYRRQGDTGWTDHEHAGTGTSTTIGGLAAGARWQVRVRAVNADGLGDWSEPGTGHTGPARLTGVAMPAHGQGLVLTFTKDVDVSGVHTAYTVMVGGTRRATSHAFWQDNTVGLVLAQPVRSGETVTVAYTQPTGRIMLHDVDDLAVASFGPQAVANTVTRPANAAATGAPTISGTARVGETLTASTAGIADADGLEGAEYAYQWVSNGDGTDADIAGATGASYALADADAGKRIKVRVSFTDDAGNGETLTSAATGTVAARVPPLTASFLRMPAEHDGHRLFSFELAFSENFPGKLDYKVLRDAAFQVTNGKVRVAKRVARGRNDRWTISVRPTGHEDVTVTLPAATDCAATGAVCTEAGRKLAETVTATVKGPALLSVADAEAREGAGAALEFRVTLSRAAAGTV